MACVPDFNSLEFQTDLYANYARLREASPIQRTMFRGSPRNCVFRHEDVWVGLRDERLVASNLPPDAWQRVMESGNAAPESTAPGREAVLSG